MSNNLNRANFFWHGESLGFQEILSLKSFVHHGFIVDLYSYNINLEIPELVTLKYAGDVLDESFLYKFTQGGKQKNIAAFSDLFRYELQKKKLGWWFDLDVVCLKDLNCWITAFKNRTQMIVGRESDSKINAANLFIEDQKIVQYLIDEVNLLGDVFPWGAIGPDLITKVSHLPQFNVTPFTKDVFYPIHYSEYLFFLSDNHVAFEKKVADSLSLHLWNEMRGRYRIQREWLPPVNSVLDSLLLKYGVDTGSYVDRLPIGIDITLENLCDLDFLLKYKSRIEKNPIVKLLRKMR